MYEVQTWSQNQLCSSCNVAIVIDNDVYGQHEPGFIVSLTCTLPVRVLTLLASTKEEINRSRKDIFKCDLENYEQEVLLAGI